MSGCVLCGNDSALVRGPDGRNYCRRTVECNYRARVRLGVPVGIARKLRADEWRELIARRTA